MSEAPPTWQGSLTGMLWMFAGNGMHSENTLTPPPNRRTVGVLRLRALIRVRESVRFAQDDSEPGLTRSATHSPTSRVPSVPPMSCVVFFSRTASSTAASIFPAS